MIQNTQTAQSYVFNSKNNALFMSTANRIAENRIHFDKTFVKQLNVMNHLCSLAQQALKEDYKFLHDGVSTRLYILDMFGEKGLRMFETNRGEIMLDIEHALVFYYKLKAEKSPLLPIALGLVYFIAAHQLDDEFTHISKVAPKNLIKPVFELSPNLFRWKRCNFVLRKYMLSLTLDNSFGEVGYFYEMPNVNQIAYLLHKGYSIQEAKKKLAEMEGGLFYSYIPKDVENMLLPAILSGDITTNAMDGYFVPSLVQDFENIAKEYTISSVYNVYTQNVKPILVDMMGILIEAVQQELKGTGGLNELRFYHISPSRLGVAVNPEVKIEEILPTFSKHFKEVKPFSHHDILAGDHLY